MNLTDDMRHLAPSVFEPSSGRWVHCDSAGSRAVEQLTLVTYNIWFGEYRWRERLAHLLELVASYRPDIIAFQEVTPRQLGQILATDWIRERFLVSDASGFTVNPHGVVLLSRLPIRDVLLYPLPSRKDRKLLTAWVDTGHERISIGNLHLESSPNNRLLRLAQLKRVVSKQRRSDHALLMGDFNFDPRGNAEQSRLGNNYLDLWRSLSKGGDAGHTVDSSRNRMRFLQKRKHKHVRFDRILLRSLEHRWVPKHIRLLGTAPISPAMPETYPSDHFGLVAVIERQGETNLVTDPAPHPLLRVIRAITGYDRRPAAPSNE